MHVTILCMYLIVAVNAQDNSYQRAGYLGDPNNLYQYSGQAVALKPYGESFDEKQDGTVNRFAEPAYRSSTQLADRVNSVPSRPSNGNALPYNPARPSYASNQGYLSVNRNENHISGTTSNPAQGPTQNNLPGVQENKAGNPSAMANPNSVNNMQTNGNFGAHANPLSASITGIGLDLMKVLDQSKTGNTVISPFSIGMTMGLLQQAAAGDTQWQISNFLKLNPNQTREHFRNLITHLRMRTSRNILSLATNIFVDGKVTLNPSFRQMAVNDFRTDVDPINFNYPDKAAKYINDWVSSRTNNKIKDLVSPDVVGRDTQMVLANALYFKGLWNSTFRKELTVPRPFNLEGGGSTQAMFMRHYSMFRAGYDSNLMAQFLALDFEGHQYSMIFIVPQKDSVSQLLRKVNQPDILRIMSAPIRESSISVPKFNLEIETDLTTPLMRLGVQDLFNSRSKLTGMITSQASPKVSSALHGTALTIDEQGGTAAAATVVAINTLSLADYSEVFKFTADRPFLLLLWDIETSLPLIIAKITDPTVTK